MSPALSRLASMGLGLPTGGGLEKLTIRYEQSGPGRYESVEALFNPNEVSLSRSVSWERQRAAAGSATASVAQEFRSVEAETLSIELFFDTYEARSAAGGWERATASLVPVNPLQDRQATDVRRHTDRIAALARIDRELHRPPVCQLRWGRFDIFTGVLSSLRQRFTLFLDNGTPVRATLSCDFVEAGSAARSRAGELHSADVAKTRTVRRNDTLQSLAAEEYRDPTLWRPIARANGIVNPRQLRPGMVLTIPKLRG